MHIASRIVLVAVFLGLSATLAQAQTSFGLRAGLNVSTISGDNVEDAEARLGILAGAYGNLALTPQLSVQPEVLFAQKGARFGEGPAEATWAISYLDIPLLLRYTIPMAGGLLPALYAGPQVSIKLGEEIRQEGETFDFDLVRGTDFGLTFGADVGTRLAGRQQQFGVGLRYTLGLTNIFDTDAVDDLPGEPADDIDAKNRVFSVTAHFTF